MSALSTLRFFLFTLSTFLVLTNSSHGQWRWQNPRPQGNSVSDVVTLDSSVVLACGTTGTILKTTDSGYSWSIFTVDSLENIASFSFVNQREGWAVGSPQVPGHSTLLKTSDQGRTWVKQAVLPSGVNSVFFTSRTIGWAVRNGIYKTIDGGLTWDPQRQDPNYNTLSCFFLDSLHGWVVGSNGYIVKTVDGGDLWERKYLGSLVDQLLSVYFVSDSVGWVGGSANLGEAYIAKTVDGGETWQTQLLSRPVGIIQEIHFANDSSGWGISRNGDVVRSVDGGSNWSQLPVDQAQLNAIHFRNGGVGYIAGTQGHIFKTTDAGNSWWDVSSGGRNDLRCMFFTDTTRGWASGWDVDNGGVILQTTNGGDQWNISLADSNIFFNRIFFLDSLSGRASGFVRNGNAYLFKTTNSGGAWGSISIPGLTRTIDMEVPSDSNCWILGLDERTGTRTLLKTTDDGENWSVRYVDSANSYTTCVEFIDSDHGWLASLANARILSTSDGGNSWNDRSVGIDQPITDIDFVSDQEGWCVGGYEVFTSEPAGGRGYIYHTTDAGINWVLQDSTAQDAFTRIDFLDNMIGLAVGYRGLIYYTTDGGTSWTRKKTTFGGSFNWVYLSNRDVGWICGDDGVILRSDSSGLLTAIESAAVSQITLPLVSQSYPNPTNSSAFIDINLTLPSHVHVEIFDLIGR